MKRSEVIKSFRMQGLFARQKFMLPEWAYWSRLNGREYMKNAQR